MDELYNRSVRMYCSSEVVIEELFAGGLGEMSKDEIASLAESMQFEGEALADGARAPMVNANWAELGNDDAEGGAKGLKIGAENRTDASKGAIFEANLYTGEDEKFALKRALSRIEEMSTARYAARRACAVY